MESNDGDHDGKFFVFVVVLRSFNTTKQSNTIQNSEEGL